MEVNNSNIGPGLEVNGQEMRYRDAFNNTLRSELEYCLLYTSPSQRDRG